MSPWFGAMPWWISAVVLLALPDQAQGIIVGGALGSTLFAVTYSIRQAMIDDGFCVRTRFREHLSRLSKRG